MVRDHGVSLQAETLINSDQGCHYTSYKFIQIVTDRRSSISPKATLVLPSKIVIWPVDNLAVHTLYKRTARDKYPRSIDRVQL